MSKHPFQYFIDLIDFDLSLVELHNRIDLLRTELSTVAQQLAVQTDKLSLAKKAAVDARKLVDGLELEMKELDQKQKEKKAQLQDLSRYKEYKSLQKELELLQAAENEKEAVLLHAWNALELAQAAVAAHATQFEQIKTSLEQSQVHAQQEIEKCEQELKAAEGEREPKEKLVPTEWLEKYNVMRSRIADPVVVVQNGSCSACFEDLTSQEIIRLNQGALLPCKGCYRLLYVKEAMPNTNALEN